MASDEDSLNDLTRTNEFQECILYKGNDALNTLGGATMVCCLFQNSYGMAWHG